MELDPELLFEVLTPLGFRVRVTRGRWSVVMTAKPPVMAGREDVVRATLESPEQIRQSRSDSEVLLFYRAEASSRCMRRREAGGRSRVLDHTYPTDAIKEGTQVWPK